MTQPQTRNSRRAQQLWFDKDLQHNQSRLNTGVKTALSELFREQFWPRKWLFWIVGEKRIESCKITKSIHKSNLEYLMIPPPIIALFLKAPTHMKYKYYKYSDLSVIQIFYHPCLKLMISRRKLLPEQLLPRCFDPCIQSRLNTVTK